MNKEAYVLLGSKVALRRFTLYDAPQVYRILNTGDTCSKSGINRIRSVEECREKIKAQYIKYYHYADSNKVNRFGLPMDLRYAICIQIKGHEKLIGRIGISADHESNNIGFYIDEAERRKGYATEASRLLINYADSLGYPYLTARCQATNEASEGVIQKLDMKYRYSWMSKDDKESHVFYQLDLSNSKGTTYVGHLMNACKIWLDKTRIMGDYCAGTYC